MCATAVLPQFHIPSERVRGCPWHPSTSWFRVMPWPLLTATKDVSHQAEGEQPSSLQSTMPCPEVWGLVLFLFCYVFI